MYQYLPDYCFLAKIAIMFFGQNLLKLGQSYNKKINIPPKKN